MSESAASTSTAPTPAVPIFKKKAKKGSTAARTVTTAVAPSAKESSRLPERDSTAIDGEESSSAVVRGKKRAEYNPLKQGTSSSNKRRRKGNGNGNTDDENDEDGEGYSEIAVQYDTRTKRAISPSSTTPRILSGDAALQEEGLGDDGLYHGTSKYAAQLPTGSSKYGPIKAPQADVRMITLVDYQPDVCKDYKETGWCGFGDSCKFLHDRGDYKAGWQLDSIFSNPTANAPPADVEEEEELPFACLICREPFKDPVVTKCGHYFCSACALKRYKKNSKCFACGSATGGLFNKATRILERKEKAQKERMRKREEEEGKVDYDNAAAGGGGGFEIEGLGEEE